LKAVSEFWKIILILIQSVYEIYFLLQGCLYFNDRGISGHLYDNCHSYYDGEGNFIEDCDGNIIGYGEIKEGVITFTDEIKDGVIALKDEIAENVSNTANAVNSSSIKIEDVTVKNSNSDIKIEDIPAVNSNSGIKIEDLAVENSNSGIKIENVPAEKQDDLIKEEFELIPCYCK